MFSVNVDGTKFGLAINVMKSYVREGFIYFENPGEMFMRGMDIAMVGIVECKLKCTCEGVPRTIAVEFDQLPTDMSGPLVLEVDQRLVIPFGRVTHKIDMLALSTVRKIGEPKVPFQVIFDLPTSELHLGFKEVTKKLDTKDTSAGVMLTWGDGMFVIEDSTQSKVDVTYEKAELNVRQDCSDTLSTVLPADYVRNMVNSLPKFQRAIVAFGKNMPVSVGVNGDGIGAGWWTSNRVV
jgi:hypothetical protein